MRVAAAAVLLGMALSAGPGIAPEPKYFRYERELLMPAGSSGPLCVRLDGSVYQHSPTLNDVRLLAGGREIPYALLTSQADATADTAKVLNMETPGARVRFDLQMPARPYSSVALHLNGENFVATAKVSGSDRGGDSAGKPLGSFSLFDLTGRRLGRDTVLPLGESSIPYLHVDLTIAAAPGFAATPVNVRGADVPPSREAQIIYTAVAETTEIMQAAGQSQAIFAIPAHMPVERVRFELAAGDKTNFSRLVQVKASVSGAPEEVVEGVISRVKKTVAGMNLREENLTVPAVLGSNARQAARVEVAVLNDTDPPLAIRAVRLEMRERRLCFPASGLKAGDRVTLFYGDEGLQRPMYDYVRTFQVSAAEELPQAQLGMEQMNPEFRLRPARQTMTDRYSKALRLALPVVLAAILVVLFALAFQAAKRR